MAQGAWQPIEELHNVHLYAPKEGDLYEVKVRGKRLCVVFHNAQWHVLDARCPHQGGPLSSGHLDESGALVCPWHRMAFDLESGQCRKGGYFVDTYPVKKEQGQLWVQFPERKKLWGWL